MSFPEIDEGVEYIGYRDAINLIYSNVEPVGIEELPIETCVGRIAADNIVAQVDSPASDVSLKDGYAVRSNDLITASKKKAVRLALIGNAYAGSNFEGKVFAGTAVKICSGSEIPVGADAVVAGEFCQEESSTVFIRANAEAGRNILGCGIDVKAGEKIAGTGQVLMPGRLGLLAAAGIQRLRVFRKPKVAIIAVGDEVVAPGVKLQPGQLYASNLVTIGAWLSLIGISYTTIIVKDNKGAIRKELLKQLSDVDAILTSGGAWGSERDLTVKVLDDINWHKHFHRVRMGPGKGVALGTWNGKSIFCLPGGPSSNEMAFLQLALPGILRIAGQSQKPFQIINAKLACNVEGRHQAWTEFKEAFLSYDSEGNYVVTPFKMKSRLQSIADVSCLLCIPEGKTSLRAGQVVDVQILIPTPGGLSITGNTRL